MSGDQPTPDVETRYTLAEAAQEIARRECNGYGHDWDIVATIGTGPARIVCTRCGWYGEVKMGDRP